MSVVQVAGGHTDLCFTALGAAFNGLREALGGKRFALYTTVVVGTIARKE